MVNLKPGSTSPGTAATNTSFALRLAYQAARSQTGTHL
jgi:hypothetical protein